MTRTEIAAEIDRLIARPIASVDVIVEVIKLAGKIRAEADAGILDADCNACYERGRADAAAAWRDVASSFRDEAIRIRDDRDRLRIELDRLSRPAPEVPSARMGLLSAAAGLFLRLLRRPGRPGCVYRGTPVDPINELR